ncbi:MAG: GNAT family N-acetyltransferase, partial [Candidatus Cloacimonetes bacterium]|nr:GNAT family N-acetyltransferase [Candidatus Cloacimonadota bacterium]
TGLDIYLRPVRISDEPLLKDFFYSLSDKSLYRRFFSIRKDMFHERLQPLVVIDYTKQMTILAVVDRRYHENIVGIGQYIMEESTHTAEVAFAVRDEYQNRGVAMELAAYLVYLVNREGLLGVTADVLPENEVMLHVFEKMGFSIRRRTKEGVSKAKLMFESRESPGKVV